MSGSSAPTIPSRVDAVITELTAINNELKGSTITPVSGAPSTGTDGSGSGNTGTSGGTIPPASTPNYPTPAGFSKSLFKEDFRSGLSLRSGGPYDAGFRSGQGRWTTLLFYGQWGGSDLGMSIYGSDDFVVNVATKEIYDLGFNFYATDPNGRGLWINTIRTPPALANKGITYPWCSPLFTTQHSFGVKPPFYIRCTAVFPDVAGMWPAFWLVGADRYAQTGHDGAPYVEVDVGEFYGKFKNRLIQALHWSNANGDLQIDYNQDFSQSLNLDFTAGPHELGALVLEDKSVQFFVDGQLVWTGHFGADADIDQFFYPILSAGTGAAGNDAGTPDASAPNEVSVLYSNLEVFGKDDDSTVVFNG